MATRTSRSDIGKTTNTNDTNATGSAINNGMNGVGNNTSAHHARAREANGRAQIRADMVPDHRTRFLLNRKRVAKRSAASIPTSHESKSQRFLSSKTARAPLIRFRVIPPWRSAPAAAPPGSARASRGTAPAGGRRSSNARRAPRHRTEVRTGQTNSLNSSSTIHEALPSSLRCRCTFVGISTPRAGSFAAWAIDAARTRTRPSPYRSTATTTQGRSFLPSRRPASASSAQR